MSAESVQLKGSPIEYGRSLRSLRDLSPRRTILDATGLLADATLSLLIQVPAGNNALFQVDGDAFTTDSNFAGCVLEVFEGPTFSAAGAAAAPGSLDRVAPNVPTVTATITSAPTVSSAGIRIGMSQGSMSHRVQPIVVRGAASQNYLVRLTNRSAGGAYAFLELQIRDA